MADPTLFSEHVNSAKLQKEFQRHWHSRSDFKTANLEIVSRPFKVCRISNFLRDESVLEDLKSELERHKHTRKVLDLYQFEKTEDLCSAADKCIQRLNRAFCTDLVKWMQRNMSIELNGNVSMSSARYRDTDRLLCHDDNMDDRRIAYILYLTKDWSQEDGGALDIFDTDEEGWPREIVRSLIPEYNSFVFFEVEDNSYHQVAEVLTDKCRWSLNGWFHGRLGTSLHKLARTSEPARALVQPSPTEVQLHSWIPAQYLTPGIMEQIHEDVEMLSYTLLKGFLKESAYRRVASELTSRDISWRMIGPPDMRRYETADEQTLPEPLKDFCDLFRSISFFRLLAKYTGLDLVPEETKRPKVTLELQRWSSGCYTLLYDRSLLEDTDESTNIDDNVSTTAVASTSGVSTSETDVDVVGRSRELKRGRIDDSPSSADSPDKKKRHPDSDSQSDVDAECSSKHERDTDTDEMSSSDERLSSSGTSASSNECDLNTVDPFGAMIKRFIRKDDPLSEDESVSKDGDFLLDVIIQFHVEDAKGIPKTEDTIDFVDPGKQDGTLIQIPTRDNHLCLVYRSAMVSRLQKYLNHFYDGYSYTFVCTYYE
ncbi:PREDICTED: prolyl 3-hydroxylase OGFOD1 [Vollenhovia emeryi]|uniref:prolyl 3-hydroxylase OGFOD1 n=1 Tax=Vollenhovia emeryi TaxID=411798 RepID=UPI0005F54432|nr:PREDICTED: prolyl 3-hydroxylase OGFOD1 [Vollenhovia emeryi]